MPDSLVIVNTSPMLYLHMAGAAWVLQRLYGRVQIPRGVLLELEEGRRAGVDVPDVAGLDWVDVHDITVHPRVAGAGELGPGESEAISLAMATPGSLLVLDDRLARTVADANGLKYTGTLGVLLRAKRAGHVESVMKLAWTMRSRGMYIHDDLMVAVAALAVEAPSEP